MQFYLCWICINNCTKTDSGYEGFCSSWGLCLDFRSGERLQLWSCTSPAAARLCCAPSCCAARAAACSCPNRTLSPGLLAGISLAEGWWCQQAAPRFCALWNCSQPWQKQQSCSSPHFCHTPGSSSQCSVQAFSTASQRVITEGKWNARAFLRLLSAWAHACKRQVKLGLPAHHLPHWLRKETEAVKAHHKSLLSLCG